ncbi:MAG: hypothetical protein WEA24_15800 [Gemmatimonadota bacterium]
MTWAWCCAYGRPPRGRGTGSSSWTTASARWLWPWRKCSGWLRGAPGAADWAALDEDELRGMGLEPGDVLGVAELAGHRALLLNPDALIERLLAA